MPLSTWRWDSMCSVVASRHGNCSGRRKAVRQELRCYSPIDVLIRQLQIVASDLLQFLDINTRQRPILIHGFSVGGYLWGELLALVEKDKERFQPILNNIVGHIWDSAADMQDIPDGLPTAVFPNNSILQGTLRKYVRFVSLTYFLLFVIVYPYRYHMRTFYDGATCHYIRSSQMFHSTMVRSPALFLMSKRDPIGKPESNQRVADNWEALGVDVCWSYFHFYQINFAIDVSLGAHENMGEFASRGPFQEVSRWVRCRGCCVFGQSWSPASGMQSKGQAVSIGCYNNWHSFAMFSVFFYATRHAVFLNQFVSKVTLFYIKWCRIQNKFSILETCFSFRWLLP